MRTSRRNKSVGFTMMEVLIAIVITSIIVSFIGLSIVGAARINSQARDRNLATNITEEKIEELRGRQFESVVTDSDSVDKFKRVWTITDNMGKPRIKDIEIVVSWIDGKGKPHNSRVNTTFYRNAYPYK